MAPTKTLRTSFLHTKCTVPNLKAWKSNKDTKPISVDC